MVSRGSGGHIYFAFRNKKGVAHMCHPRLAENVVVL